MLLILSMKHVFPHSGFVSPNSSAPVTPSSGSQSPMPETRLQKRGQTSGDNKAATEVLGQQSKQKAKQKTEPRKFRQIRHATNNRNATENDVRNFS